MIKNLSFCFFFILFFLIFQVKVNAVNFEKGKEIFSLNCTPCHIQGKNLILPEKNLKKASLEANGMNNINAIIYQITNGKNGMPAFGGRLLETEIEEVSFYVFQQSNKNLFEK